MKDISRGKYKYLDKILTSFSDGCYGMYIYTTSMSYYYDTNGKLTHIEYLIGDAYPKKGIEYDIKGNLTNISINTKIDEQYVFDADKKFISHWVGNNEYDENGELVNTRR
jgi:hypothetical protein